MAEKGHQGLDLRELAGLVGKRWQGPGFSEEGRRRAWGRFRYGAVPERRKLLRAGVFAPGDIGCRSDGADWSESVRVYEGECECDGGGGGHEQRGGRRGIF